MERLWELDTARGIAVVMMIIFHFLYDLNFFFGIGFINNNFWFFFGRATALIFIFLVGVSLTLSYSRVQNKTQKFLAKKYTKRGLRIFGYGLLVTIVTWAIFPQAFIIFGVLHFVGISVILTWPLIRNRWNFLIGIVIIIIGLYLSTLVFDFPYLLWLVPQNFYTFDYFPLMPWIGVILIGMFAGNKIYPGGKQRIKNVSNPLTSIFSCLGRHSLFIYFVHQPILLGVLWLI
jgi:uncharacterized membrane protein